MVEPIAPRGSPRPELTRTALLDCAVVEPLLLASLNEQVPIVPWSAFL